MRRRSRPSAPKSACAKVLGAGCQPRCPSATACNYSTRWPGDTVLLSSIGSWGPSATRGTLHGPLTRCMWTSTR
eukprot:10689223-Alexandrium_andersonii.AAC.1